MIHLDIKTDYSFLKAYGTPDQYIARAKAIGASCIGIADFASTWGHIPFWKACKKASIKPLFGVQLPVVLKLGKDARFDLVTLIAKNQAGLQEQYEAVTNASRQFYYRPRLTWDQVGALTGNIAIVNKLSPESRSTILSLGGNVYLGASPISGYTLSCVGEGVLPVAVACSPLYPDPAYREAYQLMVSIGTASKVREVDAPDQWMFRHGELYTRFNDLGFDRVTFDAWVSRSQEIAEQCSAAPPQAQNVKPDISKTLEEWCNEGAIVRGIDLGSDPHRSRLAYELDLIHQKGFEDYFLLIADLIAWAKARMFVGPARGSSAGSLVCYLMGIVEVDPIVHNLMFERFIDVTRTDLPDVDIDFPDERRDEVFTYLAGKYGTSRVARLGTVSVFKAKSSLGDVAKSYAIPKWEIDALTDVLVERSGGDARANMTIMDTINQFDKAKELVAKYPKIRMAEKLEGHARHTGKHAAGVVISNDDISRYCSIDHYKGGIAEITKYDAESIGLMKIDALGLTTLTVIEDACQMIGIDPRSLYKVNLHDTAAFRVFQEDRVAGIFQFEGYAVRSLMRQMGVSEFNDIVALTSLARPGPLHCGGANEFIVRRTGQKDWQYLHPLLAPHTSHTFGTIVYQEQVMSITRDLGGMDWQDVNTLRRAMSKSLGEEFFNKYREKFLKGTRERGIPDDAALSIWADMCTFGSWAFNLSHAVSYAIVSYWCAWLKTYHPLEFAVAHLRRAASTDHVLRLLREMKKEGYTIVAFDPNLSDETWSAKDGKIIGGYTGVKGIGAITARKFMAARDSGGDNWLDALSPAQRGKILAPNNTPWHNLTRLHTQYDELYRNPESYRSEALPNGATGPIISIEDIPEKAGEYLFIGTLKQRNLRDLNETQSLAKRNGRIIKHNNLFLNLQFEDDTGSILAVVNRFNYSITDLHTGEEVGMGVKLMEEDSDGHDFLIRGRIMQDGRRKIDILKIRKLS